MEGDSSYLESNGHGESNRAKLRPRAQLLVHKINLKNWKDPKHIIFDDESYPIWTLYKQFFLLDCCFYIYWYLYIWLWLMDLTHSDQINISYLMMGPIQSKHYTNSFLFYFIGLLFLYLLIFGYLVITHGLDPFWSYYASFDIDLDLDL